MGNATESIIKAPVHSPKVKKHRTPLHPPANRPVHAQPGNVNVNVNVTGNGNSNGNNTDDDSTNTHTDSLTLQSFESGTNTQTYSQTSSHIVKRSRSHGDEAFAHPVHYIICSVCSDLVLACSSESFVVIFCVSGSRSCWSGHISQVSFR